MRIVFMGTPDFAVPALGALVAAGHDVIAVYSQPPRRAGRGKAVTPSAVQARAEALGIAVRTPVSLRDADEQAAFTALAADVAVVAAYGLILPRAVLDAPAHGCLNIHGSILPRWRGAAPVQRAILAGDPETGVGIMQMEAGLDTGPVRAERRVVIGQKSAGTLAAELAVLGAELMVGVLDNLAAFPPLAQSGDGVTYAAKIAKEEARIDFRATAEAVERQVRAFNPAPGAFFELDGERFRVLEAAILPLQSSERMAFAAAHDIAGDGEADGLAGVVLNVSLAIGCGTGALQPLVVQRAGKRAMAVSELMRGLMVAPGTRLG